MRRIGLLSLLAGIVGLASQVGLAQVDPAFTDEERAWLAENPTIRIAPAPNFPPIEFFDEEGEYKGIAKDYATILESKLGVDLAVERRETWNDVVEGTKLREIDVWMEAADTPERREFMNFTAPYITLPAVIIVRRELRGSLRMGDMEGLRIAVVRGYAIHDYIRDNYPELELMLVGSIEESLEKVSFGSSYAVVANVGAASFYIERGGLTNLRVAGESGFVWKLSMAARNDWPLLQSTLQKALDSITEAERRSIYRRWIALEAIPEGWTRNQILLAAVALAIVLTFVGIRWIGRRKSDIGEIPREATLSESWPVMATALAYF